MDAFAEALLFGGGFEITYSLPGFSFLPGTQIFLTPISLLRSSLLRISFGLSSKAVWRLRLA
jgi:hypothetical protein